MDDAVWEQVLGSIAGTGATAVEDSPEEASPPDANASPSDEQLPAADDVQEPTPSDDPIVASEPVSEPVATEPAAPPPIDWNHPELKPIAEQAQQLAQLKQTLAEQRRIKQDEQFRKRLQDLSEGDSERLQEITGILAEATTPLQQQAHTASQERAFAEKQSTALLVAMKAVIPEETMSSIFEEYQALMAVEGPDVMERMAYSKRDARKAWDAERKGYESRIAELERLASAGAELAARGQADAVDGGEGRAAETLDRESRMRSAAQTEGGFNDYWTALMNPNAA